MVINQNDLVLSILFKRFVNWENKEVWADLIERLLQEKIGTLEFETEFFDMWYAEIRKTYSLQEVLNKVEDPKWTEFKGLGTLLEKLNELDNSGTLLKKLIEVEGPKTLAEEFTELEGFSPLLEELTKLNCFSSLILGELFLDCEEFQGDPALRDENDISEEEMRDRLKKHLLSIRCL